MLQQSKQKQARVNRIKNKFKKKRKKKSKYVFISAKPFFVNEIFQQLLSACTPVLQQIIL